MICFSGKLFGITDSVLTADYCEWQHDWLNTKDQRKATVAYATRCADAGCIDSEQIDSECEMGGCCGDVLAAQDDRCAVGYQSLILESTYYFTLLVRKFYPALCVWLVGSGLGVRWGFEPPTLCIPDPDA